MRWMDADASQPSACCFEGGPYGAPAATYSNAALQGSANYQPLLSSQQRQSGSYSSGGGSWR